MSNEITDQQRADLDAQFGAVLVMGTDGFGDFAFRSANMGEFKNFSSKVDNPVDKFDCHRNLCLGCLVWPTKGDVPDKAALAAAFDKQPGMVFGMGNEVAIHSGLSSKAARKK